MCMTLGYFFTNNILIILYLGEFEKSGTSNVGKIGWRYQAKLGICTLIIHF